MLRATSIYRLARPSLRSYASSKAILKNGDIKVGEGVLLSKKEDKEEASSVYTEKKGPLQQKSDADKKQNVDAGKDVNTAASS